MRSKEKDWNDVRTAFATSIMVDTSLNSLSQNLDGPAWPIKGKDETPSKYIDLTLHEVVDLLALKGQPEERVDDLIAILRDTLAFDQPFGEMVAQVETSAKQDTQLIKNLSRIDVPESLPLAFVALSADTRDFCRREKIATIGEFAAFAQSLAQSVIVGGEFRTLLNALSHLDEKTLAGHLPLRAGTRGLHLPEALALAVRAHPAPIQAALAKKAGAKLPPAEQALLPQADERQVEAAEAALRQLATDAFASPAFHTSRMALLNEHKSGVSLERLVIPLAHPSMECIVSRLLAPHLKTGRTGNETTISASPPKKGFFARLFSRG